MIVFFKKRLKNVLTAWIRTIELPIHLPDALTTALSGRNTIMPKRSNREKLVQEQVNDEKTIKKQRFLLKKNDVRNDRKTTKKRLKNDFI